MTIMSQYFAFMSQFMHIFMKKKSVLLLVACLGLLFSVYSAADEYAIERKLFIDAEKYLQQKKFDDFYLLYAKLDNYPLQPYLTQQLLKQNMSLAKADDISQFLKKYQGTALDWSLRKKWLLYLAKHEQAKLFLADYRPSSNAALTCHYLHYQLEQGLPAITVLPQVSKLWLVAKSQTKKCDPLFKRWQQAGYQTQALVWQRIKLAGDGGDHTLIPYLTKFLPQHEQYLGKLWRRVRRDPGYIVKLDRFEKKSAKETEIVFYGLKRLIWRDQNAALRTYKKALTLFTFTQPQQEQLIAKFAVALASKNHSQAKSWLDKVAPSGLSTNMVQWRLVQLLKQQAWPELITELNNLPERYKKSLQWQYWRAKALIATGQVVNGKESLKALAQQRHYYGFLAASYLKLPINLQDKPLAITEQERQKVLSYPEAKRALELFYLNRFTLARREWHQWLAYLTNRNKLVAAKIANEAQWFDRAIFTLSKVGYLDDVELRFPLAFHEKIHYHAENYNISPAWAFAVTRRESSFMADANSSAGAKGLMQLMPRTAKQLERRASSSQYLFNAANNIKLGTKYLKHLLDKNKGNQVLATASYNAGPYSVKSWLKALPALPADIWIETIPYKETREYVKSVLAYQQIYQRQVGQAGSIFDQIIEMNISE